MLRLRTLIFIVTFFQVYSSFSQNCRNVDTVFKNTLQLAKITLPERDVKKLREFLSNTRKNDTTAADSTINFTHDINDFLWDSSVLLYRYFDWEQVSDNISNLESFVEESLLKNFNDTVAYISPVENNCCNLDDSTRNAQWEKIYLYLFNRGYYLCNIDVGCDCWHLTMIRSKDIKILKECVAGFGIGITVSSFNE